jgi:hypothetical protein
MGDRQAGTRMPSNCCVLAASKASPGKRASRSTAAACVAATVATARARLLKSGVVEMTLSGGDETAPGVLPLLGRAVR